MAEEINPIGVFVSSFGVSAFAGLAALLRSGNKLTRIGVISALLNSGLLGLAIALLWYTKFQGNIYFLIGTCVLSGLGGMASIEFVLKAFTSGGFRISMGPDGTAQMKEVDKNDKN